MHALATASRLAPTSARATASIAPWCRSPRPTLTRTSRTTRPSRKQSRTRGSRQWLGTDRCDAGGATKHIGLADQPAGRGAGVLRRLAAVATSTWRTHLIQSARSSRPDVQPHSRRLRRLHVDGVALESVAAAGERTDVSAECRTAWLDRVHDR